MRLIDADAIPYREIWREDWLHNAGKYQQGVFRDEIEEMPAVDAVPVIRCKDCGQREYGCSTFLEHNQIYGFCAWGWKAERKDDETD